MDKFFAINVLTGHVLFLRDYRTVGQLRVPTGGSGMAFDASNDGGIGQEGRFWQAVEGDAFAAAFVRGVDRLRRDNWDGDVPLRHPLGKTEERWNGIAYVAWWAAAVNFPLVEGDLRFDETSPVIQVVLKAAEP